VLLGRGGGSGGFVTSIAFSISIKSWLQVRVSNSLFLEAATFLETALSVLFGRDFFPPLFEGAEETVAEL
jgi:hypothetical protein